MENSKYNPKKIEPKWQKYWAEKGLYKTSNKSTKQKFYVLDMFPYPSGAGLHVGHVESYSATDIYSRYFRMKGFDVLHPQGFDAFGLPAENYAIKTGVHPAKTTKKAINTFKRQIDSMGFSYDWSREVVSSDPEYYRWTQWFFLLLYKNGLAYKKKAKVNWCPKCQTVLANEQAEGGKCERCESEVTQKDLEQWFFKITDFVEDRDVSSKVSSKASIKTAGLLSGLDKIDWPESTKSLQKNWIGKSEGAIIKFQIICNGSSTSIMEVELPKEIEVFTTRVDTIFGCTYCVVAPEHKIITELKDKIENFGEVEKYIKATKKKTDLDRMEAKEKTGVELKGIKVINPFNGEPVLLYAADYVLSQYGTGAVMAVPAHDERDFEFAKKYNLEIKKVIESNKSFVVVIKSSLNNGFYNEVKKFSNIIEGKNSWDGLMLIYTEEVERVFDLAKNNFVGKLWYIHSEGKIKKILFHNSNENKRFDWNTDKKHKEAYDYGFKIGVKKEQLDWKGCYASFIDDGILVNSEKYSGLSSEKARGEMVKWLKENKLGGKKVNYKLRDWLVSRQRYWGAPIPIIYCEKCGEVAVPEKDLPVMLPTDVDFKPTGESPLKYSKKFQNVKCPKCGSNAKRESDTMDTFVCSSWYYLRYADPKNKKEFASEELIKKWLPVDLYVGGAEHSVLHLLYARFFTKVLHNLGYIDFDEPFLKLRHQGIILAEDGTKMSKSKGNVVNPDDVVKQFGADALRMFEMFMGPLEDMKPWQTKGIVGIYRFVEKVWKFSYHADLSESSNGEISILLNKTIKKTEEDIKNLKFNTAISSMMIFVNKLYETPEELKKSKSNAKKKIGRLSDNYFGLAQWISKNDFEKFIKLLSLFAPHIAEEIWKEKLKNKNSIFKESWPQYDPKLVQDDEIELVIQINGKVRDKIFASADISEEEAKKISQESEKIKNFIGENKIKKIIFVKGKLVNIVV